MYVYMYSVFMICSAYLRSTLVSDRNIYIYIKSEILDLRMCVYVGVSCFLTKKQN
jgi:hypothetical protein